MKNNNISFSEKKLIKFPGENSKNIHKREMVKFLFYDGTSLDYDKNLILSINPAILDNIPKCNEYYILRAPYGITKEDFSTFLYIYSNISYHNGEQIGSNSKKLYSILKLMEFFQNEKLNVQIINNIILPELNCNIAIDLIIYYYDKLCYISETGKDANNSYFELFYQSLEELSKNERIIIKNIDKLKSLDSKIVEELIQKTFRNLIFGKYYNEKNEDSVKRNIYNNYLDSDINQMNYFDENEVFSTEFMKKKILEKSKNNNEDIKSINLQNLQSLIYFLMKVNNIDNVFSLLTREYMSLLSSETINELQNMPNPSFQVEIPVSIYENYYQEFPLDININSQLLTLVIFYKIGDKSINACIKLSKKKKQSDKNNEKINNKYSFEILTFLTNVIVAKGKNRDKKIISIQNNLNSLTNNKTMYSILKIPNFSSEIKLLEKNLNNSSKINEKLNLTKYEAKENEYFFITVQIKLCYTYSVISSYLLQNFNNYINDKNISKLSKQLFILLMKNQKLNKKNENDLLKSILLWLDDEINIKEDISELFYLIKWEEIDDELIFELLIKYSNIILNDDSLEKFFTDIYLNKFGRNKIVESIVSKLFKVIKKLEYHKLFRQIKKDEKIIENLKAQKMKNDKEYLLSRNRNHKKTDKEKKYSSDYAQTDTGNFSELEGDGGEERKNNLIKKQDCIWNMSKIKKNFFKGKKTPFYLKSDSLNEFLSKDIIQKKKYTKKEIKEIPKPNSTKINVKKINNVKHNSFNKEKIININKSFELDGKEKIKRSKSNKILNNIKKDKKEKCNLSEMNKTNSKIKNISVFPINFSAIRKFQERIKSVNSPNTNINMNSNIFNKINKSNRLLRNNNNNNMSNRQMSFDSYKCYNRKNNANNFYNKSTSRSIAFSENKIKINFGIIKEVCFMNNNFYN